MIRESAFEGCTDLTSIAIPETVTKIDNLAFMGCSSLSNIIVAEGNTVYDSRGNCNAIIITEKNELMTGCKSTVIPDTVTCIGWDAFRDNTGITEMPIPTSVTEIGNRVFEGCTGLTSLAIPATVTKIIADSICDGCTSLKTANIPCDVDELFYAFRFCSALETVTLPKVVKKMDEQAFRGCTSLKTIYVPAKRKDYYKKRLPETLHSLIVELPAEKKAKKK
jgi:hypothetical protein